MSQEVDLVYLWHFEEKKKKARSSALHCGIHYSIVCTGKKWAKLKMAKTSF